MTLYLTDDTPPEEIARAKLSGRVHGVKLYPAGATTHSDAGVTRISRCFARAGEDGAARPAAADPRRESPIPTVDVFDREKAFVDEVLGPIVERFSGLKIVLEHITTRDAVQYVEVTGPNVAATITPHHLLLNRNALFLGGIRPHHYCLPVLKREEHREALVEAATSGNPKFFLGTDSAPHSRAHQGSGLRLRRRLQRARRDRALRDGVRGGRRARQARRLREPLRRGLLRPAAQQGHDHAAARGVDRAEDAALRRARNWCRCAPARRSRGSWPETHPIFDSVGPGWRGLTATLLSSVLNSLSEEQKSQDAKAASPSASFRPRASDPYYEVHLFETGHVQTRPDNKHDLFNALAWLAFPKTKARINAMHAAEIPREGGKRGRLRDMLTIFDEGGAIVSGSARDRGAGARSALARAVRRAPPRFPHRRARPRGAGTGARAASRHHLQGHLRGSGARPRCAGRGLARHARHARPATCRRCRSSAIRAGFRAAASRTSTRTNGTFVRCSAVKCVVGSRPGSRCTARGRGKSGLQRAGCGLTPRRGDTTNRATETSRTAQSCAGETRQPPSGATPNRQAGVWATSALEAGSIEACG